MKTPKINIFVENIYETFPFDEVSFHNDVKSSIVFDIVLCNDEEIWRINKEYRKIDRPTDVITFAIFADSNPDEVFIMDGEINLGEIMISLDTIKAQAEQNGVTTEDESRLIAAHGMLHLLGFDHQNENDYNFVVEMQNKIKAILNV